MAATTLGDLAPECRELAARSIEWLDTRIDLRSGLFRLPGDASGRVRESVWVAQGLLLRDADRDRKRANDILERVLDAQLVAPGQPWDGTFLRFEGESPPREGAREWVDYDPNWRQFLGCAFSLILREHGSLLAPALARRIETAVDRARAGEPEGRVASQYTNIALMKAWLDVEAGDPAGLELAREITDAFERHGAFAEYGSPTYYGVDLYALALWEAHSSSAELQESGRSLGEALWRDVARFYHAGLKNLAGPHSRAYGMDLTRYASLLGLWIGAAVGLERAPLPAVRGSDAEFGHSHDFALAPSIALLRASLPAPDPEVLAHLHGFQGERLVAQTISEAPRRRATAWLSEDAAIGAESSEVDWHAYEQYHPATLHWRIDDDRIGWLRVRHDGPVDARAEPRALALRLAAPRGRAGAGTTFEIHAPAAGGRDVASAGVWRLPGIELQLEGDVGIPEVFESGESVQFHIDGAKGRELRLTIG